VVPVLFTKEKKRKKRKRKKKKEGMPQIDFFPKKKKIGSREPVLVVDHVYSMVEGLFSFKECG